MLPLRLSLLTFLLFLATLLAIIAIAVALRSATEQGAGLAADRVPPQTGIPPIGITTQLEQYATPAERHAALQRLQNHGFGWIRQRLDWSTIEPNKNQFDWQQSDTIINAIVDQNLEPVILLDGSPAWARSPIDAANPLAPPADPHDFARFAQRVATRYANQVRFYQLWDEPNIAPHWGSRWVEPVEYARLAHFASSAIRTADTDAVIIAAALAPTTDLGHAAIYEAHYLRRLIASTRPTHSPNQPIFDVIAIQPYGFGHPPTDARQRRDILNFQRAAHIRRTLVAAGHAHTPIWAVRFGWNRTQNSPWASVPAPRQPKFTAAAIQHARANWPWLQTLGWHIDQPLAPTTNPAWGFALTEELAKQIGAAAQTSIPTTAAPPIPWGRIWIAPLLMLALVAATARRLSAVAAQQAPRNQIAAQLNRPAIRMALWIALLYAYHIATWPPLLLLLYMLAAALLCHTPRDAILIAALLLPFHFRHKEIRLFAYPWQIAPAQAILLCMMPALFRSIIEKCRCGFHTARPLDHPFTLPCVIDKLFPRWLRSGNHPHSCGMETAPTNPRPVFSFHAGAWSEIFGALRPFDLLAIAWLLINLLSITNVWNLPAYARGLTDLALAPLLLYLAARFHIRTPTHLRQLLTALWIGGVLAALLGWINWLGGIGPNADGIRRLVGPHFSPNHTALYLERTLFLGIGLWLARPKSPALTSLAYPLALLLTATALLLTASRGALLLGIPAGIITLYLLTRRSPSFRNALQSLSHNTPLSRLTLKSPSLIPSLILSLSLILSTITLFTYSDRLLNSTTLWRRTQIWQATTNLWRDHLWTGVGPNGFFWRYPAYILDQPLLDPNITHPHNVWLELGASWGIFGILWLFAAIAAIFIIVYKQKPAINTWLTAGLISAVAAGFAHAHVDTFTNEADLAAWNWIAFAALTISSTMNPISEQNAPPTSKKLHASHTKN